MNRQTTVSQLNARKCIDQRTALSGSFELSELERLCGALADDRGQVDFELHFGIDEEGYAYLRGQCHSDVVMICERCLKPVGITLDSEFEVGVVYSDDQAKHLPKRYEPVLVQGDILDAREVLEDELLLSLPMYAVHAEGEDCEPSEYQAEPEATSDAEPKKENPFGVLAQLKK